MKQRLLNNFKLQEILYIEDYKFNVVFRFFRY